MHPIQSIILSVLFTHLFLFSKAQSTAVNGWLMSANSLKIKNSPFTGYFDAQFRSSHHLQNLQSLILRPGLQYNFNKKISATVGYAFIQNRRTISGLSGYAPEHRIWQQLQVLHPIGFTMLNHRVRLEQRFIAKSAVLNNSLHNSGHAQANRLRYFFRDILPFSGSKKFDKGLFAALQNEIFINIGDKSAVNGKYFDQNRAYGAFGYRFSPKFDLEAGYLNQYVSGLNRSVTTHHNIQIASYIRL